MYVCISIVSKSGYSFVSKLRIGFNSIQRLTGHRNRVCGIPHLPSPLGPSTCLHMRTFFSSFLPELESVRSVRKSRRV